MKRSVLTTALSLALAGTTLLGATPAFATENTIADELTPLAQTTEQEVRVQSQDIDATHQKDDAAVKVAATKSNTDEAAQSEDASAALTDTASTSEESSLKSEAAPSSAAIATRAAMPADATTSNQNQSVINTSWHHYNTGKGYYNPADEGKEVAVDFFLYLEGTNAQTGKVSKFWGPFLQEKLIIGQNQQITVPLQNVKQNGTGVIFNDCKLLYVDVYLGVNNHIYGASTSNTDKDIQAGIYNLHFSQNMSTKVDQKLADDAIVLDEHKDNMAIRYTVQQTKKDDGAVTYPVNNNNGEPIEETVTFTHGKTLQLSGFQTSGNPGFRRAVEQNTLEVFNPYTGKNSEYQLKAEFTGNNADELNKYYTLHIEGNDLDGWVVTVTSKLTQVEESTVDEIDFTTKYEDDNTLEKGKQKVSVEGKKGSLTKKYNNLYLVDPANPDSRELVKSTLVDTTQVDAVDEVILVGTKEMSQNADDDKNQTTEENGSSDTSGQTSSNMNEQKPITHIQKKETSRTGKMLPRTGDENFAHIALPLALGGVVIASGAALLMMRRTQKHSEH